MIDEIKLAIKVASTQEGQALPCTQEWLEGVLKEMERLSWEVESLQYKYDKYRETALNRVKEQEEVIAHQGNSILRKAGKINQLIIDNERMKDAIGAAHQSLTWSNTENQVPHAIWHLEQVLNLRNAPDSTAQARAEKES